MNKIKYCFTISLIYLLLACKPGITQIPDELPALEYLDTKIKSWVDNGYYNGAAAMVKLNNELLFENYYGGYTDTTAIHVASAGKWVAAATIASIVEEGKLSWNDKVKKYLPEFKDEKGEATLLQLLSHTAGYPDYQPRNCRRDDYQTLKEAVENILPLPYDTLPGTKFRYGGLAMQVAGRMAEIATGKDWETLFQVKIARPLNMQKSYFVPVSLEGGFNPMLGGGLRTCLRDYMNFLEMIAGKGKVGDKQILSSQSIQTIEADQVGNARVNQPEYVLNARQNYHNGIYGLGMWRDEVDKNGQATLVSSPGWAGAYPWVDRKNNAYGFIIAKVNGKAHHEGFSSFYGSAVLPVIVRDAIQQKNYPSSLTKGKVNIGDAQLYYEEMGQGEPLILIHGHSLNHTMWDDQFYEFARYHRVIRYDIRGYGYSSPQTETRQFTHVDDLIKLMDALKIDKAHIVGLSLGGYIGADMLGLYPNRILSATLASGNARLLPKPSIPMNAEESARREEEIALLKKKGIDKMKREWYYGLMKSGGTQKERMRNHLWNMIYQWDAWQPLHREVRVISGGDAYDKLKENCPSMPVLILEGQSENNRFPLNPEILNYLPNGKIKVIDDCGHMLNMERSEEFNKVIMDFINNI